MQRLFTLIISIISVVLVAGVSLAPHAAAQTPKEAACEGVAVDGSGADCGSGAGNGLSGVVKTAIRIFQTIVGVIAIFVLITAGLSYITSGGDGAKTKTAKDRILYAVIGLVVVALAEAIVQFALNRVDESASEANRTNYSAAEIG